MGLPLTFNKKLTFKNRMLTGDFGSFGEILFT